MPIALGSAVTGIGGEQYNIVRECDRKDNPEGLEQIRKGVTSGDLEISKIVQIVQKDLEVPKGGVTKDRAYSTLQAGVEGKQAYYEKHWILNIFRNFFGGGALKQAENLLASIRVSPESEAAPVPPAAPDAPAVEGSPSGKNLLDEAAKAGGEPQKLDNTAHRNRAAGPKGRRPPKRKPRGGGNVEN